MIVLHHSCSIDAVNQYDTTTTLTLLLSAANINQNLGYINRIVCVSVNVSRIREKWSRKHPNSAKIFLKIFGIFFSI